MSEITELQKKIKELEASAENDIDCILISIKVFSLDYSNPNRVADTIKLYEGACTVTNNSRIKTETLAFLKKEAILSVQCRKRLRSIYNNNLIDHQTISNSKAIWLWYNNEKFAIESILK